MARWQNYIFPLLLMACLPAEIMAAVVKGTYPTLATLLVMMEFGAGWWMVRRTDSIRPLPETVGLSHEEKDVIVANARLNRMLGAGLIIFGLLLTVFMLASFVLIKPRATLNPTAISIAVEVGFAVLFNLLIAVVVIAGVRIYTLGTK